MKVGILTSEEFAFGTYGGFGFVARKTANILRNLGHEVCIIDVSLKTNESTSSLDGIPVYFLLNRKVRMGPIGELDIVRSFNQKVPLDIILGISVYSCGKWAYYFKKVNSKLKSILWFQDVRTSDDWKKIFSVPKTNLITFDKHLSIFLLHERYRNILRAKGVKTADKLIAQAKLMIPKINRIYKIDNVEILPNPVPIPEEKDIDKQENPLVVFLGRLDLIKRPWIYAELARNYPDAQFLVLGMTHYPDIMNPIMEKYRQIENLQFLGLTQGKDKADILSRAWVLVNTSVYESLPVSFLEALSYKMAILSCQNPDYITSEYGFYTGEPVGEGYDEVPEFAEGLEYLISNNRWKLNGERGYNFVKDLADERKIAKRLDQILNSV